MDGAQVGSVEQGRPPWRTISSVTRAATVHNEDAVFADDARIVVVDGASGLGTDRVPGAGSDARWFASAVVADLPARLRDDDGASTRACLSATFEHLSRRYDHLVPDRPNTPDQLPSASVLVVRVVGTALELTTLGDCTAVVRRTSGAVEVVQDDTVVRLDARVLAEVVGHAEASGRTVKAAAAQLIERMRANRRTMNTPDGYWVADLSGAGVPHALQRSFELDDVAELAVMTDGMAAALDPLGLVRSPAELLDALREDGPSRLAARIVAAFEADPDFTRYPRLKAVDDISAVHILR